MIDLNIVEQEIMDLEKKDTSYAVIERLSWLYVVRDHMATENARMTDAYSGGEFAKACSNVPMQSLMDILEEHMEAIQVLYPREYDKIMHKIIDLKS